MTKIMPDASVFQLRKLYSRRWIFLFGLFLMQVLGGISFASYGQVSIFYVHFFNATHDQVDWITNARNASTAFLTIPLAWFVFKGKLGVKNLTLLLCICSTVGLLFVTLSLINGKLFKLIIIGQLLCGAAESLGIALVSTFPVLWFPDNQVGTAIAINTIGLYVGDIGGYIIPTNLLFGSSNLTVWTQPGQELLHHSQITLLVMYGSFLSMSTVVTFLFSMFMTDKPPTAPTHAQEIKNNQGRGDRSFTQFRKETYTLLSNCSFVMLSVAIGLTLQIYIILTLMLPEVMAILPKTGLLGKIHRNVLDGLVMSVYSIGAVIGLLSGGKVVDRCKKYKALTIGFTILGFVSASLLGCAVVFKLPWLSITFNFFFGFCAGLAAVVMMELMTQLTYPIDELEVSIWGSGINVTVGLLCGVIGRAAFNYFGATGVLVFQSLGLLTGVILIMFISPVNRRLEAEGECRPLIEAESQEP